jgi:DNA primase
MRLWQAGINNTVAPMESSLSPEWAALMVEAAGGEEESR